MPEPLKDIYTREFFDPTITALEQAVPGFAGRRFLTHIFDNDWEERELKQRMKHIATVIQKYLPLAYPEKVKKVQEITRTLLRNGIPEGSFQYMFLGDMIEDGGQDHLEHAIAGMETVTQLASCEFCIRSFLVWYPERMMKQMATWTEHAHPQVRRLATEGCRPRLPWGAGVPTLKRDPSPILPILEKLRSDPSEMVRRSVANNLNDISKDHPELVLGVVREWSIDADPELQRVIRHACRTLVKKSHPEALELFELPGDVVPSGTVRLVDLTLSDPAVPIGGTLNFSFSLSVCSTSSVKLRVDYAIDYLKSSGKSLAKKFNVSEGELPAGTASFSRSQSFRQMTTRRHYPGLHRLSILVNGSEVGNKTFEVVGSEKSEQSVK